MIPIWAHLVSLDEDKTNPPQRLVQVQTQNDHKGGDTTRQSHMATAARENNQMGGESDPASVRPHAPTVWPELGVTRRGEGGEEPKLLP